MRYKTALLAAALVLHVSTAYALTPKPSPKEINPITQRIFREFKGQWTGYILCNGSRHPVSFRLDIFKPVLLTPKAKRHQGAIKGFFDLISPSLMEIGPLMLGLVMIHHFKEDPLPRHGLFSALITWQPNRERLRIEAIKTYKHPRGLWRRPVFFLKRSASDNVKKPRLKGGSLESGCPKIEVGLSTRDVNPDFFAADPNHAARVRRVLQYPLLIR